MVRRYRPCDPASATDKRAAARAGATVRMNELFSDAPRSLRRIKSLIPLAVRDGVVARMLCSDPESRRNLEHARRRIGADPTQVHLRALRGEPLWVRPGTDDPWIVRETMTYADCLPPAALGEPRVILDLGANIGASMALLATRFPRARIIGVEPDPANAELCRANVRPWSDRCEVVEAAAWTSDGTVRLSGTDVSALTVAPTGRDVRAMTIASLLAEHADGHADYIKMDIEGAEVELLSENTAWAGSVRCVSVEVHAPYTASRCEADLRALDFVVTSKPAPRVPRVVGQRPPSNT